VPGLRVVVTSPHIGVLPRRLFLGKRLQRQATSWRFPPSIDLVLEPFFSPFFPDPALPHFPHSPPRRVGPPSRCPSFEIPFPPRLSLWRTFFMGLRRAIRPSSPTRSLFFFAPSSSGSAVPRWGPSPLYVLNTARGFVFPSSQSLQNISFLIFVLRE